MVDDPRLQDGMQQQWAPEAVAEHVARAVQRLQPVRVSAGPARSMVHCWHCTAAHQHSHATPLPTQVYTFDAGGVSGHPNHLAAAAGVLRWWADTPSSSAATGLPEVWQLQSVGLARKYAALGDAPLSWLATTAAAWQQRRQGQQHCRRAMHAVAWPSRAWRAMRAHRSQMVW